MEIAGRVGGGVVASSEVARRVAQASERARRADLSKVRVQGESGRRGEGGDDGGGEGLGVKVGSGWGQSRGRSRGQG